MEIEQVLESIGLNKKEIRVYLTCLKTGQEKVFNIARKSGLKRSTVYFVLDRLASRGLASIKKTPKAIFYSVASPKKLLSKVEQEKSSLEKVIPQLEEIYKDQPYRPKIETFEGRKGIELVYREAAQHLNKGEEVLYFGSTKHFLTEYNDLLDLWIKEMKNQRYKAREIMMKEELKDSDYIMRIKANNNPNHRSRFFPTGIRFNQNDNMIYGNKLAIFSLEKEVFVILIDSKNIVDSYRNLFEMAWQVSKPI